MIKTQENPVKTIYDVEKMLKTRLFSMTLKLAVVWLLNNINELKMLQIRQKLKVLKYISV
jgi:hypothetical protein